MSRNGNGYKPVRIKGKKKSRIIQVEILMGGAPFAVYFTRNDGRRTFYRIGAAKYHMIHSALESAYQDVTTWIGCVQIYQPKHKVQ